MTVRLVLLNPNTNENTTATMAALARAALPAEVELSEMTVAFGTQLIVDEAGLAAAADAVSALVPALRASRPDGVIVSAFGDPGLQRLRDMLDCPSTGIAEAAFAEAAAVSRPFAVVTTTPDLAGAIGAAAVRYGHGSLFRGCMVTTGDPGVVMADPRRLIDGLAEACDRAIQDLAAEVIVIGGGPLAAAAQALQSQVRVPLIEPVPAAARLALRRLAHRSRVVSPPSRLHL